MLHVAYNSTIILLIASTQLIWIIILKNKWKYPFREKWVLFKPFRNAINLRIGFLKTILLKLVWEFYLFFRSLFLVRRLDISPFTYSMRTERLLTLLVMMLYVLSNVDVTAGCQLGECLGGNCANAMGCQACCEYFAIMANT